MALSLEQASAGNFVIAAAAAGAGLGVGSTPANVAQANAATIVIDGVYNAALRASSAAGHPFVAASGFTLGNVNAGYKACFGVWVDSSGNVTMTQGQAYPVGANSEAVGLPPNPGSRALLGLVTVYNQNFGGTGAAWIPGTSALTTVANQLTSSFRNLFSFPATGF